MVSTILSPVIFLASFLLVLSFLVFFHEMGHYAVAKFFKVHVERFSVGFGKPIARLRDKSGTEWTFSRIPLGGYVKFLGDAGAASNPDRARLEKIESELRSEYGDDVTQGCFHFKPLWQRALIVLAGPMANFILATILFAIVAMSFGQEEIKSVVYEVQEGGAAQAAGVMAGDRFLTMDDHDVSSFDALRSYIALRSGEEIAAKVMRNDEVVDLLISPKRTDQRDFVGGLNGVGTIGVRIDSRERVTETISNPLKALGHGGEQVGKTISMTGTYVKRIFQGREDGSALGGPLRIMTMTGKTSVDIVNLDADVGRKLRAMFYSFLMLSAVLSIGLGVANLMPIPTLDGGHLLYYGYEAIAGRPLSEEKQEFGFRIGLAFLLTMLVFITINDIGYIRSIFT